jgi:phosphate-selective porin
MCYTPVVDTVRQDDILREFPGRTEADLYLWLSRNHGELKTRYGGHVSLEEAAGDLAGRFGERASPARRLGKMLRRWGRKGMNRGAAWWAASRRRLSKRSKRRSRL